MKGSTSRDGDRPRRRRRARRPRLRGTAGARRAPSRPYSGSVTLNFDSRQLLGELADALQKWQPARVELDAGEQGLDCNLSQSNRWKNFVVTGGHSSN